MIQGFLTFLLGEQSSGSTLARYQRRGLQLKKSKLVVCLVVALLSLFLLFSQNEPSQLLDPIKYYWPQLIALRPIYVRFTRSVCVIKLVYEHMSLCRESRLYKQYPTLNSQPDQVFLTVSDQLGATFYERVFQNSSSSRNRQLIVFGHIDHTIRYNPENVYIFVDTEPFSLAGFEDYFPRMLYIGHLRFPETKGLNQPAQAVYLPFLFLNMLEFYQNPNLSVVLSQNGRFDSRPYFAVYAQSKCIPYRERAFDLLVEYAQQYNLGEVHAVGGCHGSHPEARRHVQGDSKALGVFTSYKYSLTAENTLEIAGYMTEKILSPFIANSVPIYFGTDEILKIFDSRTFFYMSSLSDFEKLLSSPENFSDIRRREMVTLPKFTPLAAYYLSVVPAFSSTFPRDVNETVIGEILRKTNLFL